MNLIEFDLDSGLKASLVLSHIDGVSMVTNEVTKADILVAGHSYRVTMSYPDAKAKLDDALERA
jgi:hypothetical protein